LGKGMGGRVLTMGVDEDIGISRDHPQSRFTELVHAFFFSAPPTLP
jgi:hypothetical protein